MFIVRITPGGVREVQLEAKTEFFEDLDLAIWPLLRQELGRLDRKLKKAAKKTLDRADQEGL